MGTKVSFWDDEDVLKLYKQLPDSVYTKIYYMFYCLGYELTS